MSFPNLDPQTIAVHSAAAKEYTRLLTLTALDGSNISADPMTLCLGGEFAPGAGTFVVPDTLSAASISVLAWKRLGGRNSFQLSDTTMLYQRSGALFVGDTFSPIVGSYWLWMRLTDSPASIPRRGFKVIIT